MKSGGCRLVCGGVIACVVVAIDAQLEAQSGNTDCGIEVGVYCEFGQSDDIFIGTGLVCQAIVPMQCPYAKILLQAGAEYLYAAAVLPRQAFGVEVYVVLNVFYPDIQRGAEAVERYTSANA